MMRLLREYLTKRSRWLPALVHGLIGDYQLVHETVSTDTQKQMEKQNDTVQNTRKQNCSGFIYRF
jgi:hypothetical protein